MANTTSAKKATRKIARKTEINKSRRTFMRGQLRKMEEAIQTGDKSVAQEQLKQVQPVVMKSASKGIIHKNAAARKISRLSARVKALNA
ncbi:MAG: 30S ribosomal protein S20 [Rhizobiaceae bacterium]